MHCLITGVNNNVVRIPVSSGSFLDLKNAVLGYKFKNTSAGGTTECTLDGGAACVIQRLRVLSNQGMEIERLDQYGQLHAILDQYSGSLTSLISNCAMDGGARRISYSTKQPSLAIAASTTGVLADGTTIETGAIGGSITIANEVGGKGYMQEECDTLNTAISDIMNEHDCCACFYQTFNVKRILCIVIGSVCTIIGMMLIIWFMTITFNL